MQGKCELCLKQQDLQLSHIIPKFVLAWLKTSQPGRLRAAYAPNQRIQDAYKIHLLCRGCEGKLAKYETEFCEKFFLPVHQGALSQRPIDYGPWALKCLVSISWRVGHLISRQSGMKGWSEDQVGAFDRVMKQWRLFLLGEEISMDAHHLLPMDLIKSHTLPKLSSFMNRYIVGSLDLDLVRSGTRAYAFAKLGYILLFGTITDQHPNDWNGTTIAREGGTFSARNCSVPASIMGYINGKANHMVKALSQLSPRQKELIDESVRRNLKLFGQTEMAKAVAADIHFSGDRAFLSEDEDNPRGSDQS